jgi:UDP-N-acetylglucosamine acyltransferase
VILEGRVHLGQRNRVASFACIGGAPQDKKYAGEETSVEIGDDNTIREYVTINRGTVQDAAVTRIGHRNWIMAYVHFAHDCQIGNDTIFANACQVAGHVHVDDWAILGATTLVHQFVRIGAHSFTAMGTFLQQDLPCYVTAAGNPAQPYGINSEGLRRRGFSTDAIAAIKRAYKAIYRSGQRLEEARQQCLEIQQQHPEVAALSEFLSRATRGIIR